MKFTKTCVLLAVTVGLAGCVNNKEDKTVDRGIDSKHLSQLKAGIWIDPTGCDHWIIDDGIEGYLSQRLQPDGKPVCGHHLPPGTVLGDFQRGSTVSDLF